MIGKEIYAKAVKARKKGKYERASNKQNCQEIEVVYSNQNLPKKGVIKKIRQGILRNKTTNFFPSAELFPALGTFLSIWKIPIIHFFHHYQLQRLGKVKPIALA